MVYKKIQRSKYFVKIDKKNLKKIDKKKKGIWWDYKKLTKTTFLVMFIFLVIMILASSLSPSILKNIRLTGLTYGKLNKITLDLTLGYNMIGFYDRVNLDAFRNKLEVFEWNNGWSESEGNELVSGKCYLMFNKVNEKIELTIRVTTPGTISLDKGWNCLIWPGNGYMIQDNGCIVKILDYNGYKQRWISLTSTSQLKIGKAYLVYSNEDCEINLIKSDSESDIGKSGEVVTERIPRLP